MSAEQKSRPIWNLLLLLLLLVALACICYWQLGGSIVPRTDRTGQGQSDMTGPFFDRQFWQSTVSNVVATFIGAALGVWTAFWFERHQTGKAAIQESEKEAKAIGERRKQLISVLKGALEKNLDLLNQMEREVPKTIIYYNVDVELLESTASLKYEAINDLEFNRQIDAIRYELLHLHRKVDLQLQLFFLGRSSFGDSGGLLGALRGAICGHIPHIKGTIAKQLEWIGNQQ